MLGVRSETFFKSHSKCIRYRDGVNGVKSETGAKLNVKCFKCRHDVKGVMSDTCVNHILNASGVYTMSTVSSRIRVYYCNLNISIVGMMSMVSNLQDRMHQNNQDVVDAKIL